MRIFSKKQSKPIPRRRLEHATNQAANNDAFRRNRTLVGSTSDNINGINVVKSGLESPRAHIHGLAIRRRRVCSVLLVMLLSMAVIGLLIYNFTASPTTIISGKPISKTFNESRYNTIIQDYLDANPMGRLSFLLDQSALTSYVSSKLPEVSLVELNGMERIGQTSFAITMRQPVAGWEINGKQYYVDSKGVSFELNYYTNPSVQIIDNTGVPIQAGTTSVSKRLLGFVGLIVSKASQSGYIVTKAILPAGTMRELDINIQNVTSLIKFTIDRSVGEQVEDMGRALQYFMANGQDPSYIDVRVSNKAFYK